MSRPNGITRAALEAERRRADVAESAVEMLTAHLEVIEAKVDALLDRPIAIVPIDHRRLADGGTRVAAQVDGVILGSPLSMKRARRRHSRRPD